MCTLCDVNTQLVVLLRCYLDINPDKQITNANVNLLQLTFISFVYTLMSLSVIKHKQKSEQQNWRNNTRTIQLSTRQSILMSFIFISVRMMLQSKEIFIVRLLYYPHLVSFCLITPHLLFSNWPLLFTSLRSPPLRSSVSDAEIFCDIISVAIKIWLSEPVTRHPEPGHQETVTKRLE